MLQDPCPCNSGMSYEKCCRPYLEGDALADTPEKLMRSRYSAFVKKDADYLLNTHHPSKKTPNEHRDLLNTMAQTVWLGLVVIEAPKVADKEQQGCVEFAAFYRAGTQTGQIHEKSSFAFEAGRWYYLDGEMLPPLVFGRNQPCWCGSRKKYKKCHGR